MQESVVFPEGFLWGSSVSAHQTEGNNSNTDWWVWEQKGGGKEPSGIACDSYNRYGNDIELVERLNQNAFRVSVEWARIEPKEGYFDQKEVEHYKNVLREIKKKGIKTFVTLHHFTNPLWFMEKGGWENPKAPKFFSRYAKYCSENFSDLTDFWITINEPTVYVGQSYFLGIWPPQKRNLFKAVYVCLNMVLAHNRSVPLLKGPAGIAHNITRIDAATKSPLDRLIAKILNLFLADMTLFLCTRKQAFIGLNYYSQFKIKRCRLFFDYSLGKTETELPVAPEGLYKILVNLKKYKKPIYITENGCADAGDKIRQEYIRQHLINLHKAIKEGVDVRGYLHWSLIDNFEWHLGFKPRFGLVEIDRENNLQRRIRKSAEYYAKICKSNKIE